MEKFIQNEEVDIICLQEVYLELIKTDSPYFKQKNIAKYDLLDYLVMELQQKTKHDWKYISTANTAIRADIDEFSKCTTGLDNAIVYRSDLFKIKDGLSELKLDNFLSAKEKFKMDKNNIQIVEFTSLANNGSFILINTHLPFNKRPVKTGTNFTRDIKALWNIYEYESWKEKIILVAGDFNLPNSELSKYTNDIYSKIYLVNEPTTISLKEKQFYNPYDHFILSESDQDNILSEPKRAAKVDGEYICIGTKKAQQYDFKYFKQFISDHVPIIITINIPD